MLGSEVLPQAEHAILSDDATSLARANSTISVCQALGLFFDPWQVGAVRMFEATRADGKYAARTVALSVPRQSGKTFTVGAMVLARCLAKPGLTAVWTAHRFGVARETFDALNRIAESPKVAPHIARVTTAAGNETIQFHNGSRIVFKARERAAIRGFSKVGLLVLDEAQILSDAALGDMLPTTNQHPDPQVIMLGTPPRPNDPGEAFTRTRKRALDDDNVSLTYVQFSGDTIAAANPSYPHRTGIDAVEAMRTALAPEDFSREALGIWDDDGAQWIIPSAAWFNARDERSRDMSLPVAYGLDVSPNRSTAAIAAAYILDDETWRVEVVKTGYGTDWIVPWLSSPDRVVQPLVTVLDAVGPAGSLVQDLIAARVRPLLKGSAADMKAACGLFFDGIISRSIRHLGDPVLTEALAGASKRQLLDAWAWSRKDSDADITPLVAATLAVHGLSTKRRRATSAPKSNSGLVVLPR